MPLRWYSARPIPMSSPLSIDTNKLCLAGLMKEAGYSTACIGKWHLGFGKKKTNWNNDLKPGPLELGFDYYYGVPQVNSDIVDGKVKEDAPPYSTEII